MKPLLLKDLMRVMDVKNQIEDSQVIIKKVVNKVHGLDYQTLVFHLFKDEEINYSLFNRLDHCYLVTDQVPLKDTLTDKKRILLVANVQSAYQSFISYYRNLFSLPVVAITGTCGKTTVKEMITQILKDTYQVAHTILNHNALINNLFYLTSIDENTEVGVFETALLNPGNLIESCRYFEPNIGIITNIGVDHLSGCKTVNNYIRAKGEMVAGLKYQGTLIINNDDENIQKLDLDLFFGEIITFGIKHKADFQGKEIEHLSQGVKFRLDYKELNYSVFVPGVGEHNVYNTLASIACLVKLGLPLKDIIKRLKKIKFIESHLEFKRGRNNAILIDDSWSSNPTSVEAALKVLAEKGRNKIKILVLGKIAYLGNYANEYAQKIAQMIIFYKVDFLISVDSFSQRIQKMAIEMGMNPNRTFYCHHQEEQKQLLDALLNQNTIVLFKFSMLDERYQDLIKELTLEE